MENYIQHKVYPKIDWVQIYESDDIESCISGFDVSKDNIIACYNGTINESMVSHIDRLLKISDYKNKLLVLTTSDKMIVPFSNFNIQAIRAHKDVIELQAQNFNIADIEADVDFITLSRKSKRLRIEEFLEKKWASCTWDSEHYPDPIHFEIKNEGPKSNTEISHLINQAKYGYFSCNDNSELNPPFQFWLCGKPAIVNITDYSDGLGYYCRSFNHINLNDIRSLKDISFDQKWDSNKIRNHALAAIHETRTKVNDAIDCMGMSSHLKMDVVDMNSLPMW